MKRIALSLIVASMAASASAQTATTTTPAPATSGTTSAPIADQQPAEASKWTALAIYEGSAAEQDARKNVGGAKIDSLNQVSVGYKVTPTTTVSLLQDFAYNHLAGNSAENKLGNEVNRVDLLAPAVRVSTKVAGIWGSKEMSPSVRYYIPASYERRAVSGYYGSLRADVQPTWEITTKTSASVYVSPRATLAPRENVWTDASGAFKYVAPNARLVYGPTLDYAFNDNLSVGTYGYMDQLYDYNNGLSFSQTRKMNSEDKNDFADTEAILRNNMHLGLGLTWTTKALGSNITVNPYLEKVAGLQKDYSLPEERSFQDFMSHQDNMTYNLFLSVGI